MIEANKISSGKRVMIEANNISAETSDERSEEFLKKEREKDHGKECNRRRF